MPCARHSRFAFFNLWVQAAQSCLRCEGPFGCVLSAALALPAWDNPQVSSAQHYPVLTPQPQILAGETSCSRHTMYCIDHPEARVHLKNPEWVSRDTLDVRRNLRRPYDEDFEKGPTILSQLYIIYISRKSQIGPHSAEVSVDPHPQAHLWGIVSTMVSFGGA